MKKNRNDFLDVYKWCQENGIDFSMDYALSTDIKHLRTNEKIRLSAIETKTVFLKIIENNEKYQKSLYTTGSIISRQRKCDDEVCNAGKYSLNMIYDGTLISEIMDEDVQRGKHIISAIYYNNLLKIYGVLLTI